MKKDIHPKYHSIEAQCACGAKFAVGSVKEELRVDICSACHPFFTGTQKIVDSEGRVERFRNRAKLADKK